MLGIKMTKTDFAELKEKLTKLDDVAANAYLTRYMEGGYEEPTYQQYGDYIHTKYSAIISELIEIIKSQSEALDHVNEFCLCKRNTYGFDYHEDHPVQGLPKSGSRWLTPRDRIKSDLSETTARLQKLRDGK